MKFEPELAALSHVGFGAFLNYIYFTHALYYSTPESNYIDDLESKQRTTLTAVCVLFGLRIKNSSLSEPFGNVFNPDRRKKVFPQKKFHISFHSSSPVQCLLGNVGNNSVT